MADFYGKMKAARVAARELRYKVLQSSLVKSTDRDRAMGVAAFVTTGDEAYRLQGHDGFEYQGLDVRGRCGVVKYKGIEVALLFKRIVVEIEPGPGDPAPEMPIKDPAEAWIQLSLLDAEPHQQSKGIADRLRQSLKSLENFKLLWTDAKQLASKAQEDLMKYEDERASLLKLPGRVETLEKEIAQKDLEIERLTRKVKEATEGRVEDRTTTVQELFPVINTVWLAGVHRVGDKLYEILNKQLVDALGKVGVSLIEPRLGDEFRPELHHAVHVAQFPAGAKEINTIVAVHKVGWKIGSRVVEAADVQVGIEKEEIVETKSEHPESKEVSGTTTVPDNSDGSV